jgi:hypothetical protein
MPASYSSVILRLVELQSLNQNGPRLTLAGLSRAGFEPMSKDGDEAANAALMRLLTVPQKPALIR